MKKTAESLAPKSKIKPLNKKIRRPMLWTRILQLKSYCSVQIHFHCLFNLNTNVWLINYTNKRFFWMIIKACVKISFTKQLYPFLEPMRKVCYPLGLASLSTTCGVHKVHRALLAAQTEGLGWCNSPKYYSRCLLDSWTVTRALTR